jgi:ribosomal protein L7/L12
MAEARELLEIKQRLALLETRVQQLFEHLYIEPRSSEAIDPTAEAEIQDLVAKGNKVVAIKRYRELTGLDLAEAKAAIDRMRG